MSMNVKEIALEGTQEQSRALESTQEDLRALESNQDFHVVPWGHVGPWGHVVSCI